MTTSCFPVKDMNRFSSIFNKIAADTLAMQDARRLAAMVLT